MSISSLLEFLPFCRRLMRAAPKTGRYKRGRHASRQRDARPSLADWPNSAAFHRELPKWQSRRRGSMHEKSYIQN
jgi:hypothetical protein